MPHSPTTPAPIAAMGERMIARFALAFPLALLTACADYAADITRRLDARLAEENR